MTLTLPSIDVREFALTAHSTVVIASYEEEGLEMDTLSLLLTTLAICIEDMYDKDENRDVPLLLLCYDKPLHRVLLHVQTRPRHNICASHLMLETFNLDDGLVGSARLAQGIVHLCGSECWKQCLKNMRSAFDFNCQHFANEMRPTD